MKISPTTRHRAARYSLWLLLLASLAAQPALGQDDWPAWGHDPGNQRHSPLTQIDTSNVSTLVPAWRYEMTEPGVPSRPAQSTPLRVVVLKVFSNSTR
jgi:glucose dehydrogenase